MSKQNPKPTQKVSPVTRKGLDQSVKRDAHRVLKDLEDDNRRVVSKAAQSFWDFLGDPFSNKPARPVWFNGDYSGVTGLVTGRNKGILTVGSRGIGFVMFSLDRGPTTKAADCPVTFTGNTYAGVGSTTLDTSAVGTNAGSLSDVPYSSTEDRKELIWRPIAGSMRITPRGSMTSQDGIIAMLEVPGHVTQYGSTTFDSLSSNEIIQHPRTRVIRAAQLGDPSVVNQLNWHPQSVDGFNATNYGQNDNSVSDIKFRPFNTANTTRQFGDCIICIEATAGLQFEFEFIGAWETRGSKAVGLRPSIQDAHASAIIFNTLCRQRLSGMVGKAHEFRASYHAAMHDTIRKHVATARNWVDVGKDVASMIKEVAGFVL